MMVHINTSTSFHTRNLTEVSILSSIVAALMTILSLAGILFPEVFYLTDDLRQASIPTDIVNLVIGLPILVGVIVLGRRGVLLGLLFWPGTLLFMTYHAIAFAAGVPFSVQFYLYVLLVGLSTYTLVRLLASLDANAVQQRLRGRVFEKVTGGALVGMGLLFASLVAQIITNPAAMPSQVATGIADMTIIPVLLVGGVLLFQRHAWGYVVGEGLLFLTSMLFVGLLVFFILQPIVTGAPFPLEDFIAIAVMSLVGFIPFGLFVRGLISRSNRTI
jgi:hypothetical protein